MPARFSVPLAWVRVAVILGSATLARCGGDRSRSPTCGLALLVGPAMVQQRMTNILYVLTDAPRGLPPTLPARVAGQTQEGEVLVAYDKSHLVMGYQGAGFPASPGGFAVLVVDDSTQRAQGVLLYEPDAPRSLPPLGAVTGTDRSIPLFGMRVDWAGVSNPRCPLLGPSAALAAPSR